MKLSLNYQDQVNLFVAFQAMDKAKLGTLRHQLVKNIRVLRTTLKDFDDAKKGALLEIWPDAPQDRDFKPSDFPEGGFAKWKDTFKELTEKKDEIELNTFPRNRIYTDENDIPVSALDTLEEHGLFTDPET